MIALLPLPPGKITVRWRQMRAMWQCFAGNTYMTGASGETPEDAIEQLVYQYAVLPNTSVTIHGYRTPVKTTANPTQ